MNQRQACNVADCAKRRHGLSYYCRAHASAAAHHGHPLARKVKKKDYADARSHVVRFLRIHADHPAVIAAYRWAELWLREAAAGQNVPAQENMARLAAGGVTGAEIVEDVLALWLHSRQRPAALPDDARLTKALGTNILLLTPRDTTGELTLRGQKKYRRLGATVRAEVGEHIRRTLGGFVLNAFTAIDRQMKTKQDHMQALRLPFSSDATDAPAAPPEGDTNTQP